MNDKNSLKSVVPVLSTKEPCDVTVNSRGAARHFICFKATQISEQVFSTGNFIMRHELLEEELSHFVLRSRGCLRFKETYELGMKK